MVRALPRFAAMARCAFPFLLLVVVSTASVRTVAQPGGGRVEILHADLWNFDERIAPGAQRLIGNVRFKHADALMHCDSAYLYQDQRVDAFGRVRILQGDTLTVEAGRLRYDGRDRVARLEGDVRLRDRDMELSTPTLTYDLRGRRAIYTEGGRIVDHSGSNTLTSRSGTYLADEKRFLFNGNVRLEHPERIILSDTMHYATASGVARFLGPTEVLLRSDSTVLQTLRGSFETRADRARFDRRSSIRSKARLMEGDSLHYDRIAGLGLAWGNVLLQDTASRIAATGDRGRYDERRQRSMVTGRAELIIEMDGDTLFLHADSLFTEHLSEEDSTGTRREGKRIQAHPGVRFFKSDMQGACDTLVYLEMDSIIQMDQKPVLWSGTDQITGRDIRIALRNGKAHRLYVEQDAFLMTRVDSSRFDQVSGTSMTGFFDDEGLRRLVAEGNSRTVYFAREERDGREEIIGVNRADCSRIEVGLVEGGISTVTFLERPEAVLYPLDKIPAEELRMKGATWRGDERPVDRQDIFRK